MIGVYGFADLGSGPCATLDFARASGGPLPWAGGPGAQPIEVGHLETLASQLRSIAAAEACGRWDLALEGYQALLNVVGSDYRVLANAGQACWYLDRPRQAFAYYRQALALQPADGVPWLGVANALRDLNRFEAANVCYERSLELAPAAITAWNRSQVLVGLERFGQAFALAEQRLQLAQLQPYRLPASGAPLAAAAGLHLWSEQGFGDSLQFLRWCVPLSRHGVPLVLELDPALVPLAREGLAWLPAPLAVQPQQPEPPPLLAGGAHCSLLSLPHHLGGAPLPEVFAPTGRQGVWQGYLRSEAWPLREPGAQPRVGLVWAAGRKLDDPFAAREYRKRSLPAAVLGQLVGALHTAGAELVNLQFGHDRPLADPWRDRFALALPSTADFAETAGWIRQLDLLISVDTAAAHLAGALGHPCWLLLPYSADPRWLRRRVDCPWYPSLRLFRQPATGQWLPVLEQVMEAFRCWWP